MTDRFDVAVVGAGIVGLGAAYAALRRDKRVVVIDRTSDAQGSTVRNFGHLCIGAQTGIARRYADAARPIWLNLAERAEFWLRTSGTLIAARHADELALLDAAGDDVTLLSAAELRERMPVATASLVGGAHVAPDLQTHPRTAAAAIRRYLESQGVTFLTRTAVGAVGTERVETTRGTLHADLVVVCVNHDLDQLLPDLAESVGVVRCTLDMMRVRAPGVTLQAPLLTGWSLVRYGAFAGLAEAGAVRERLHAERPDLAALDLNQMYTQLPDGSIIVGDTHARGVDAVPFQPEVAGEVLLEEFRALFGTDAQVIERWQGIYASGPDEFLIAEPERGVVVLAATTGIGMTCGLGLAETELAAHLGPIAVPTV